MIGLRRRHDDIALSGSTLPRGRVVIAWGLPTILPCSLPNTSSYSAREVVRGQTSPVIQLELNGLVFAMEGAEALHEDLLARGLPVQSVQRFSRAVDLPGGETGEARINVVRIEPRTVFDGRTYFCEHLSPELIWRPEWQAHPNGARGLERIALSARDPNAVANVFDRMFGTGAVARTTGQEGPHVLRAGKVAVEVWPQDELSRTLGPAMPDPAGRADHLVLLGIRVHSLRETRELLRANGIQIAAVGVNRILVPSTEAMNVAMEFVA